MAAHELVLLGTPSLQAWPSLRFHEIGASAPGYALVIWLREQIVRDGIDAIQEFGVDVGIVFVLLASWIVCDIQELISKVVGVSYAMVVIAGVPDFSWGLLAYCKGVSAFDVLDAFCC
jgi:hypothetical protein